MSQKKNVDDNFEKEQSNVLDSNLAVPSDVSSVAGSVKNIKQTTSERQIKFERAQKCLENAALVSKRIKEHRKATAELLGRPFEDDSGDPEMASTMSEKTNYSVTTDTSTTLSVQDALNIPGISESLANTLKQKELLMERIKQYKEISKRPMKKAPTPKKDIIEITETKKSTDNIDITKLTNTIKEKENALSIMQVKIRSMETTILDLQEKINEKDQIIESKNKATTIITDSLSKKEKDTLDLLEDTKQQMSKMQSNFIAMETEWKEEKQKMLMQMEEKDEKIKSLEEANTILENSRFEISVAHSKLAEELDLKLKEISELQEKIKEFSESQLKEEKEVEQEKGSLEITNMEELTKKVELLEQINYQIRQTNKELESQLSSVNTEVKAPGKKGSPLPTRKAGRNPSKSRSPWSQLSSESLPQETEKKPKAKSEMLLQSLNKDILDKEFIINDKNEVISKLEATIQEKIEIINELQSQVNFQKDTIKLDVGVATDCHNNQSDNKTDEQSVNVKDLEDQLKSALDQIATLNNEIDIANKNMIKVKSNSKLKLKQMQKSIDNFSKVSDANSEIVKLNEELHQLSQKVAELEEEKGNLQLHLVDYDGGRLTETEVYKKMVEMENLAEARLKSITLLETQKFDLVQELHNLQQKASEMEDKLADMSILQNEQVCSEMKLVQLEEQIDDFSSSKKELEIIIENLKLDKEQLNDTIKMLQNEKEELSHKLDNYIQENIDLTDRLEKLSAEKVSSAESIEMVESLTTQEKMELEEYNRSIEAAKNNDETKAPLFSPSDTTEEMLSKEDLMNEIEELKKKIELFTQERQEVMERMNKMSTDNDSLQKDINDLRDEANNLQQNIVTLKEERNNLQLLNESLNSQIEELKRERVEVVKETVEVAKRASVDESVDGAAADVHTEDKSTSDKGINRSKSVKQLTKEILKLKNIIKEREDEIADCQMKILSLEEQQQKQKELAQSNASYESVVKRLNDENNLLKKEISTINKDCEQSEQLHQDNERLKLEIHNIHQEYTSAINARDSRIHELEKVLLDYEKQAISYSNSLQQKDKEMSEYINKITQLNDISQKLKSTIDLLEEEKSKNNNAELVKSLTKKITIHQNTLADYEEKIHCLEDEKTQLNVMKTALENKINNIEAQLKTLQDTLDEKQKVINEMHTVKQTHSEELSNALLQAKERDEEIHEIKLQLRKESIENEKLRTNLEEKIKEFNEMKKNYDDIKEKLESISLDHNAQKDQYVAAENKNRELMEKLKKFAITLKKKSAMNTELENQLNEARKQIEGREENMKQLSTDVNAEMTEKLSNAEIEINRLQTQLNLLEQKNHDLLETHNEVVVLRASALKDTETITTLSDDLSKVNKENIELKSIIDDLNKKLAEYEIELKNNTNLLTKISCLEAEVNQKQMQITELSNELQNSFEKHTQIQYSNEAKIQELDLYVETLQTDIDKYKGRIYRLEQSISAMENSRQSLERKADQLDFHLQEKQKAYDEYTCQEDELVTRLAVLMDHDKVVEKQLYEIERENQNLKNKIHNQDEELQKLQYMCLQLKDKNNICEMKVVNLEAAESEVIQLQNKLCELEANVKRLTNENQTLNQQKKKEIEEIELEFNTQIENTIKEKKNLSERCEKLSERVNQLETELQEYKTAIDNLNVNIEGLSCENRRLQQEMSSPNPTQSPDYTEQCITEITNLHSQLNSKNEVISDLSNKTQSLHEESLRRDSINNSKISELSEQLQASAMQVNRLENEIELLKQNNDQLHKLMLQKEEQIKQLKENKKLVFEMNIPKTEGMTISSTIESIDQKDSSLAALESQIIDEDQLYQLNTEKAVKKQVENVQNNPLQGRSINDPVAEPEIIPKKTYVCYKENEQIEDEPDPFNSDEGWGLETNEESDQVMPGMSHLNKQIEILTSTNEKLKSDLDVSNGKLMRAIKKLKELKAKNEMLTNDIKLSKQLSESSFLDAAIEKELASNVQALEKKIDELNNDLNKEKREKEAMKKQNEVLKNANDRLVEMKEKMDNEIELWKYNLKQANDKLSTMEWGGEFRDSESVTKSVPTHTPQNIEPNTELLKLEKEYDELQTIIEELKFENKGLLDKDKQLQAEIASLKLQLEQSMSNKCEKCEKLEQQLEMIQKATSDLESRNATFADNIQILESQIDKLKTETENLKINQEEKEQTYKETEKELLDKNNVLCEQIKSLKAMEDDYNQTILSLSSELESANSKLSTIEEPKPLEDTSHLEDKCKSLEESCTKLKSALNDANSKLLDFESRNEELMKKFNESDLQILELNNKIQQLNSENDQLLSTVAELRSSISSAMDQRGFEIAELWKQHLAQRENEFQVIEQDLRNQLNTFEGKYEQLLENMQSSSQEETNKIVIIEQVSSLQNKLKEKEEHLLSLQEKYAEAISQLDMLRSEMEDEKVIHENKSLVSQEENEKYIKELTAGHQEQVVVYESKIENLQSELNATKTINTNLTIQIEELRRGFESQIQDLNKQLQLKESEIFQKTHDFTVALTQRNEEFEAIRQQLVEYERKVEELTYEKEAELAILRLKIHEISDDSVKAQANLTNEKDGLYQALNEKIIECTNLNKTIIDLNKSLEEYSSKSTETQMVLESQELEIVTLKDEITSLKEMLRTASTKIEKHVTFASDTKPGEASQQALLNKELLDAVPKAELDLALYMLHQRDVRCEELTMELTQLLEERDTLQLRLSDSLRSYEELKAQISTSVDVPSNISLESVSETSSTHVEKHGIGAQFVETHRSQSSRSSSISDPDGGKPNLQAKLSELRGVKHSRDVRFRHESEQRQLGMRLLQRDVANLPPEAIDQLTQAQHTLSRDTQSTPTVLLNWLRGKSTPKVVHM